MSITYRSWMSTEVLCRYSLSEDWQLFGTLSCLSCHDSLKTLDGNKNIILNLIKDLMIFEGELDR
jgi:hypothetical protein